MREVSRGIRDEIDGQQGHRRNAGRIGYGTGSGGRTHGTGANTGQLHAAGQLSLRNSVAALRRADPRFHPMQRILEPEHLDSLPVDHPDARHSRRDLRLTNRFLGTHRWIENTLPGLLRPGESVLEIGAGTGELGRRLVRKGLTPAGLDLWPRPVDWPAVAEWHREDLRTFPGYHRYQAIVANLILHHFSDADLADLGGRLRRTARVIIACEPARRRVSQLFFRTLAPWFGANAVTLHDAHVSIAAGFSDDELPRLLGLDPATWQVRHTTTTTGVYRLTAVRRDPC